ncbi:ROK family transcriptional regulator [Timonella senegalensis]|uniref:ROK family transcriptional regulator n=1 Tax=Timonella senegalensis TaxID=1465825 RepID=UPI000309F7B0|nr:ROK family transcriptional regulator [Timonella senegalensis]
MVRSTVSSNGDLVPSAILALLGRHGAVSRADIARMLDVSPATVTQVTKSLIERELIEERASVPSAGGRPARLIGLVQDAGGAIGVKVASTHVQIVEVAADGDIIKAHTHPYNASADNAIDVLGDLLEEQLARYEGKLLGIGVGIAGSVNSQESGTVIAPTLGWNEVKLGPYLRKRLGVPVLVENDVNALSVAERLYGTGQKYSSFLTITIGRGIGCGIIVDGALHRGASGGAGEIGHVPAVIDGPLCDCGAYGCLEALVGQKALEATGREHGLISQEQNLEDLLDLAARGSDQAQEIFKRAGYMLGRAIAGVVHTVDPEIVVLLGEGIAAWEFWQPGFEKGFRSGQWAARSNLPYIVESWADDKWALGAAALVLAAPFDARNTSGGQGKLVRERLSAPVEAGVGA